jgi:hypothetical protein
VGIIAPGSKLRGTWHDRSAEYRARATGKAVKPGKFTTTYDIKLTPLPCLLDLTEDERQAHYRRVVGEVQAKAEAENKEKGRTPMTVEQILAQDPHSKPATTDRSPAPCVHATDDSTDQEFRVAYRAFVDAFRAGALRLRDRAKEIREMFPIGAFPPQLPFNESA